LGVRNLGDVIRDGVNMIWGAIVMTVMIKIRVQRLWGGE
jgi:hypothetical protein